MRPMGSADAWAELEQALEDVELMLQRTKDDLEEANALLEEEEARALGWRKRAEEYRRQLGGTTASLNRCRHENRDLKAENDRLMQIAAVYRERLEEMDMLP